MDSMMNRAIALRCRFLGGELDEELSRKADRLPWDARAMVARGFGPRHPQFHCFSNIFGVSWSLGRGQMAELGCLKRMATREEEWA